MENKPRFKVGDTITYKYQTKLESGPHRSAGSYRFGGQDFGGQVGVILTYEGFHSDWNCYKISVTTPDDDEYSMLECEFEEWDRQPAQIIPERWYMRIPADKKEEVYEYWKTLPLTCTRSAWTSNDMRGYLLSEEYDGTFLSWSNTPTQGGLGTEISYELFESEILSKIVSKKPDSSLDNSDEDPLIIEAKRRYPVGTKFIPAHVKAGECIICTTIFKNFGGGYIYACLPDGDVNENKTPYKYGNNSYNRVVYYAKKGWADIIEPENPNPADSILGRRVTITGRDNGVIVGVSEERYLIKHETWTAGHSGGTCKSPISGYILLPGEPDGTKRYWFYHKDDEAIQFNISSDSASDTAVHPDSYQEGFDEKFSDIENTDLLGKHVNTRNGPGIVIGTAGRGAPEILVRHFDWNEGHDGNRIYLPVRLPNEPNGDKYPRHYYYYDRHELTILSTSVKDEGIKGADTPSTSTSWPTVNFLLNL